ncbi:hypothetical protein SAMN05216276_1009126 [Streptosporangium subroseum]|uniref:Uncharacterized protein n=1 Tax=Streptosporangium subroseum TaxID=106412 RepID=A0A239EFT1_9ACTN|nr:hypothetical protein SAMN05216276_1009126 [Streptosporangium subroseum]
MHLLGDGFVTTPRESGGTEAAVLEDVEDGASGEPVPPWAGGDRRAAGAGRIIESTGTVRA